MGHLTLSHYSEHVLLYITLIAKYKVALGIQTNLRARRLLNTDYKPLLYYMDWLQHRLYNLWLSQNLLC